MGMEYIHSPPCLQLGLEGPPEEESCVVEDDDYYLGYHAEGASDEEDLSLASLYAVAGVSTQVLPKPAAEPAPPVPAPPPPRPSGSIALGGLLAAGGDRAFYTPSPPAAGARSLESRPGSGGPPLSTSLLGQGPLPPEPQPSTYYQDQGGAFQDPSVVAGAPGLLRHQQALAGYAAAPPPPVVRLAGQGLCCWPAWCRPVRLEASPVFLRRLCIAPHHILSACHNTH